MDELLALFEENPAEEAAPANSSLDAASSQKEESGSGAKKEVGVKPRVTDVSAQRIVGGKEKTKRSDIWTDADHRVGFRITKRLISSIDLTDMLTTNNFHTPASLCAMSLKQLNALLVDPAQVIDKATVAGRTNIMTAGVVFSNTGTRIAKSGNAFLIASIGSLRTGPSVSVMLFGSVFRKFCKKLVPGTAVAIVSPRLVPPKDGYSGETSITFSLNDDNQVLLLGQAQDFGICKAKVRGKNERGIWTDNARRCRSWVDTSVCEYCKTHRLQRHGNKKSTTDQCKIGDFRQQDKFGMTRQMSLNGRTLTLPVSQNLSGPSRFSNMPATGSGVRPEAGRNTFGATQNTTLASSHGRKSIQLTQRNPSGSLISRGSIPSRPTLQPGTTASQMSRLNATQIRNPYSSKSKPVVTPASTRQVPATKKIVKEVDLASMISGEKRKKDASNAAKAKRVRVVNTDTANFDGSVPVPKPKGRMASTVAMDLRGSGSNRQSAVHKTSSILEKQREMATKVHSNKDFGDGKLKIAKKSKTHTKAPVVADQTGWCAPLSDTERERLRNVKSSFAREADAEDFALSRSRITELEKEEEKKQASNDKGKQPRESKLIRTMWKCLTCSNRTFAHYPKRCYMDHHNVVIVRELREDLSREQKRSALSSQKAEEGGLKLGSGIEWSWSRFS